MKKSFAIIFFIMTVISAVSQKPLILQLRESKPDTARISILLQLAAYYFDKGSLENHMDSVEFYLKQAYRLNENFHVVNFYNQINIWFAKHYCAQHAGADVKSIFLPIIDTCKKTGDTYNEQQAWTELGDQIGNDQQTAEYKISCYQNAMKLARQRHDKNNEMAILRYIADVHLQQRRFDLAESELLQILSVEKQIKPVYVMYTYDLLGAVYMTKGTYDKALFYGLKTVKTMEAIGDSTFASTFYNRLSIIYRFLGKPAESIEWSRRSLNYSILKNDYARAFTTSVEIAIDLINEGKAQEALNFLLQETAKRKPANINERRILQKTLGSCYNAIGKYDLAEKCYVEMIRLGGEQKYNYPNYQKGDDNYAMGLFYLAHRNFNKAHSFLEISLKAYEEYGVLHVLKDIHLALFRTDSALGNYVTAIKHLEQSKLLNDSIFSIARNKQIEELQIAYETDKKDKNFRLLEGKEKLTRVQLQHTKNTRNWIITGAAMLLIIAALLYRQALVRKKNNKVIKNKNDQLQHLVTEKEWLLKEVHHRVKNNLQTVMGLLGTQSGYLKNEAAIEAVTDSQRRIQAMSLIHQKLYQTENLSTVNMRDYIQELADHLRDSYNVGNHIRFNLEIERIELDIAHCIPLGLILNEAITNSFKYAFPGERRGDVFILFNQTSDDHFLLMITDNGTGLPAGFDVMQSNSMGMNLMRGLSEEIGAEFTISSGNGTQITVSFVYHPETETTITQMKTESPHFV